MNRILLVLSGADSSQAADLAIEAAQQRKPAEIVALYVIDEDVPSSVSSWLIYVGFLGDKPSDDYRHTILKEYRRRAQEDLADIHTKIVAAGLAGRTRLEEGPLLETIKRVGTEEQPDLMIMAIPGKSEVGAALYRDAAQSLQKGVAWEVRIV